MVRFRSTAAIISSGIKFRLNSTMVRFRSEPKKGDIMNVAKVSIPLWFDSDGNGVPTEEGL